MEDADAAVALVVRPPPNNEAVDAGAVADDDPATKKNQFKKHT